MFVLRIKSGKMVVGCWTAGSPNAITITGNQTQFNWLKPKGIGFASKQVLQHSKLMVKKENEKNKESRRKKD